MNRRDNDDSPDEIYREYTSRPFPTYRWAAIVATNDMELIGRYNAFRKQFVDALIDESLKSARCSTLDDAVCTVKDVGSATLTSDYDVNITGHRAAQVVDTFNRAFRNQKRFPLFEGQESSVVFDTNVYGAAFQPIENAIPFSIVQRKWAWMKFFKLVGRNQFKQFLKAVDACKENVVAAAKTKKMDYSGKQWLRLVGRLQNALQVELNDLSPEDRVNAQRERNVQYVIELYKIQRFRSKQGQDYSIDADDSLVSHANYYGEDMYYTRGAYQHVVKQRQSKSESVAISSHGYIDSAIENSAQVAATIYYAIMPQSIEAQNMIYTKVSKYIARAVDAALKSKVITKTTHSSLYDRLVTLYTVAETVRVRVRGKTSQVSLDYQTKRIGELRQAMKRVHLVNDMLVELVCREGKIE